MENINGEFLDESRARLESSLQRLFHCLDQLDYDSIWWRPNDQMNSIGVLIIHICGSFRQWAIAHLNDEEDLRHRPDEFSDRIKLSTEELREKVSTLQTDFMVAIEKTDPLRLTEKRRIQGFDTNVMRALFRALVHLEGHIGQILLLTRICLGDKYKIFWTPQTEEQKAERKTGLQEKQ